VEQAQKHLESLENLLKSKREERKQKLDNDAQRECWKKGLKEALDTIQFAEPHTAESVTEQLIKADYVNEAMLAYWGGEDIQKVFQQDGKDMKWGIASTVMMRLGEVFDFKPK
jgi:hypothetical protein